MPKGLGFGLAGYQTGFYDPVDAMECGCFGNHSCPSKVTMFDTWVAWDPLHLVCGCMRLLVSLDVGDVDIRGIRTMILQSLHILHKSAYGSSCLKKKPAEAEMVARHVR